MDVYVWILYTRHSLCFASLRFPCFPLAGCVLYFVLFCGFVVLLLGPHIFFLRLEVLRLNKTLMMKVMYIYSTLIMKVI